MDNFYKKQQIKQPQKHKISSRSMKTKNVKKDVSFLPVKLQDTV